MNDLLKYITTSLILITLSIGCGGGGDFASKSSVNPDDNPILSDPQPINFTPVTTPIGGEDSGPTEIETGGPVVITDDVIVESGGDITLDPGVTVAAGTTLSAPDNCQLACSIMRGCENKPNEDDQATCINECGTQTGGICDALPLGSNADSVTSFTVPAGYAYVDVELRHCTDRQDRMTIAGPSMAFTNISSNGSHGWEGASVGEARHCGARFIADTSALTGRYIVDRVNEVTGRSIVFQGRTPILDLDDDGNPIIEEENVRGKAEVKIGGETYIWHSPASTSFNFSNAISGMDVTQPVFILKQDMKGPGLKRHSIFDTFPDNDSNQLTFLFEYHFFYDPTYETKFRLYYSPVNSITGSE